MAVLSCLIRNQGRLVRREIILAEVWGPAYADASALLHDAISRLRRRFTAAGALRSPIETMHGVGYRIDP